MIIKYTNVFASIVEYVKGLNLIQFNV